MRQAITRLIGVGAVGGLLSLIPIGAEMATAGAPSHASMTHHHTSRTIFVSASTHDYRAHGDAGHNCAAPKYHSISAAVDAASAGDTIIVCGGHYREGVTIDKTITLKGEHGPVLDATGNDNGVNITAAHVSVKGLTVKNAIGEGIIVSNVDSAVIEHNVVEHNDLGGLPKDAVPNDYAECKPQGAVPGDCGEGIHLMGSSHSTVAHNVSQHNSGGILVSDEGAPAAFNLILDNRVANNVLDCGITVVGHNPAAAPNGIPAPAVAGVHHNTVAGNDITGNGVQGAGAGVVMATGAPGGAVYDNLIEGNHMAGNGQSAVTVHNHIPGQYLNGNVVIKNRIDVNNIAGDSDAGAVADTQTTGVLVGAAEPLTIEVKHNVITGDHFGIWTLGPVTVAGATNNTFRHVDVPVQVVPLPSSTQ